MTADYIAARTPLVERAYQLARSGRCKDDSDVHGCLISEGYHLSAYFKRPSLNKDLLRVCREARDERPASIPLREALRQWFATVFLIDGVLGDAEQRPLANQG